MKKSYLALVFFVILAIFAQATLAEDYAITQHKVNIQLNTEGKANVIERFYIYFPNEEAKVSFREKSAELGSDLDKWTLFNNLIEPSIGSNNQANKKILYTEGDSSYLEISYEIIDPIMSKGKETTMMEEYSIKVTFFNNYYQSGLWVIPDNTSITIELPPGADTSETVEPEASIGATGTRKTITWTGYKSSNKLSLNYILWKKIAPVIDMTSIINFLFKTMEGLTLIGIIVIVIVATIWKRKKISAKIEEFVENNSLIEED